MTTVLPQPVDLPKLQKKEVEIIKVLAEKVTGFVKWYNPYKCYGFISRYDDGSDLFVHRSVISNHSKPFPSLLNGEDVEFSVVETTQGIEATYVTGPGGKPVKGTGAFGRRYRPPTDSNNQNNAQITDGNDEIKPRRFRPRSRRTNRKNVTDNQTNQSNIETLPDETTRSDLPVDHKVDDSIQPPMPRERRRYRRRRHPRPPPEVSVEQPNSHNETSDMENETATTAGGRLPDRGSIAYNRPYGRGYRHSNGRSRYSNGRPYFRRPMSNGYKPRDQAVDSGTVNNHNGCDNQNHYGCDYGSQSRPFMKNRASNRMPYSVSAKSDSQANDKTYSVSRSTNHRGSFSNQSKFNEITHHKSSGEHSEHQLNGSCA